MSESRGRLVVNARLKVDMKASPRKIQALKRAMTPEASSGKRCEMKIGESGRSKEKMTLYFDSTELVSLRASLNTNLRLLDAALETVAVTSPKG